MVTPAKIKKLDTNVVNKIAAGEIIQRPANAIKELIENSLDAQSTNIQITAMNGGLKLLQIQDNGTGIRKEDLDIVCERFTTSKLQKMEDLQSLTTYGFRGEALASISHVALLTITTKTSLEKVAYKASYCDGKLKCEPKAIAGNQGTIITIENLFYNVPTRKNALKDYNEEYLKIVNIVTRYAIHNSTVGFTLKKHGEVMPHVKTFNNSNIINNITTLYGKDISKNLIELNYEDNDKYKFKFHSLITNPNYSSKRLTFLLFINHRLVESTPIKKMLDELYEPYIPKKSHPFCYLSLEIDPKNVDVNLHPTKSEVRFIHEDSIINQIKLILDEKLFSNNSSRTFYLQAKLPQFNVDNDALKNLLPEYDKQKSINKDKDLEKVKENDKDGKKKLNPKLMIRTDSKEQKLDQFNFTILQKSTLNDTELDKSAAENVTDDGNYKISFDLIKNDENKKDNSSNVQTNPIEESLNNLNVTEPNSTNLNKNDDNTFGDVDFDDDDEEEDELIVIPELCPTSKSIVAERAMKNVIQIFSSQKNAEIETRKNIPSTSKDNDETSQCSQFKSYSINNFRREVKLTSILKLRKNIEDNYHRGLRKILSNMVFIGCVDEQLALFQHELDLYICNTVKLAEELFYEIMLYDFANFGVLKLSDPLSIKELSLIGLNCEEAGWTPEDGTKDELADNVKSLMIEKSQMLKEYFSIVISDKGDLKALPVLLENYFPSEAELPLFILRLATEVDWNSEQPCFQNICRETAKFYSKINTNNENWKHSVEFVLYPAIKESMLPPEQFAHDSTILLISNLPHLYKDFERC